MNIPTQARVATARCLVVEELEVRGAVIDVKVELLPYPGGVEGPRINDETRLAVEIALRSAAGHTLERQTLRWSLPEVPFPVRGRSLGLAAAVAARAVVLGYEVPRHIAFSGAVEAGGQISAVSGVTEKLHAAELAGVREVYIPHDNLQEERPSALKLHGVCALAPMLQRLLPHRPRWGRGAVSVLLPAVLALLPVHHWLLLRGPSEVALAKLALTAPPEDRTRLIVIPEHEVPSEEDFRRLLARLIQEVDGQAKSITLDLFFREVTDADEELRAAIDTASLPVIAVVEEHHSVPTPLGVGVWRLPNSDALRGSERMIWGFATREETREPWQLPEIRVRRVAPPNIPEQGEVTRWLCEATSRTLGPAHTVEGGGCDVWHISALTAWARSQYTDLRVDGQGLQAGDQPNLPLSQAGTLIAGPIDMEPPITLGEDPTQWRLSPEQTKGHSLIVSRASDGADMHEGVLLQRGADVPDEVVGYEIIAAMVDAMIHDRVLTRVSPPVNALLCLSLSLSVALMAPRRPKARRLAALLGGAASTVGATLAMHQLYILDLLPLWAASMGGAVAASCWRPDEP